MSLIRPDEASRHARRRKATLLVVTLVSVLVATPTATPSASAAPQASTQIIYPTGDFPTDVENVQEGVDLGGTVILKAHDESGIPTSFNFGSSDHEGTGAEVRLQEDVQILGETINSAMSTIEGGWLPIFGIERTHTVIDGINFEGQGLSAMVFIASSGAEITNNRVAGVVGTPLPSPPFPSDFLEGRGIKFLGNNDPEGAITGSVVVANNIVEDMHADFSDAIVFDAVAADVEIVGNRTQVEQSSGVLIIGGSGSVDIADNELIVEPGLDFLFGNGIAILGGADSYDIKDNRIVADDFFAEGIFILGDEFGSVPKLRLDRNHVTLVGSVFGGITLQGDVPGAIGNHNRIDGDGSFGFDLLDYFGFADPDFFASPSGNRFTNLEVVEFDGLADTFLDSGTSRNALHGNLGSVIDLGTNNRLINLDQISQRSLVADQTADWREQKVLRLGDVAKSLNEMTSVLDG